MVNLHMNFKRFRAMHYFYSDVLTTDLVLISRSEMFSEMLFFTRSGVVHCSNIFYVIILHENVIISCIAHSTSCCNWRCFIALFISFD